MSPVNISPINIQNLKTKYSSMSNYAQRFIKSQVRSISFSLESFFSNTDIALISKNEQKLKEIGIKQIGNDKTEGIILFDNKYDYHVFSPNGDSLNLNIFKLNSEQIYQHFCITDKKNEYSHAGNFTGLNIEDELSNALDFIDGKLIDLKRECLSFNIPNPLTQNQIKSENIAELMKTETIIKKSGDINCAYIGLKEKELLELIEDKVRHVQELYKKISDCRTKYKVKSSYKNYNPQPVANKLGFKNIGQNGESIAVFNLSYRNNAYTAISVTDKNRKDVQFVISKDSGSIRKNLPSKYVNSGNSAFRVYLTPDYYSQKEIDESNLYSYLTCLNKEMDLFIQHTQNWFTKKEERILIRSNYDNATLDLYKDILDDISLNFEEYRTKMRKYLRKSKKSKNFKKENGISVQLASTAVKFENITPEGYDLRLSYPKVKSNVAMQLLVMQGDEIKKSFYIINNKLLRFNIKDLNDKIRHYGRNMYYYDKKYLKESNLSDYLLLIKDKLHNLNEKLDAIRNKQIENKKRYHIKNSKEEKV